MAFAIGRWAQRTVTIATTTLASAVVTTLTATLVGVKTDDIVVMEAPSSLDADLVPVGASISAADTLAVRVRNLGTATAVTTGSQTWGVLVVQGDQSAIPEV